MTDGLSARREEARTSLTASPSVALIFSSRGLSSSAFSGVESSFRSSRGGGLVDGLQIDVAVLGDGREDDLVDIVVEDEDLDVLLLVDLEQRRVAQHALRAAGDVVERLLLGLHALFGLGERGEPFDLGGLEADEVEQRLAIGEVAVETFLERTVVLGDELRVLLGIVGGDVSSARRGSS